MQQEGHLACKTFQIRFQDQWSHSLREVTPVLVEQNQKNSVNRQTTTFLWPFNPG